MPSKTFDSSSTVDKIEHREGNMYVTFRKTGTYQYSGVPLALYDKAIQAESIGSWVYQNLVKGEYPVKKMTISAKE